MVERCYRSVQFDRHGIAGQDGYRVSPVASIHPFGLVDALAERIRQRVQV